MIRATIESVRTLAREQGYKLRVSSPKTRTDGTTRYSRYFLSINGDRVLETGRLGKVAEFLQAETVEPGIVEVESTSPELGEPAEVEAIEVYPCCDVLDWYRRYTLCSEINVRESYERRLKREGDALFLYHGLKLEPYSNMGKRAQKLLAESSIEDLKWYCKFLKATPADRRVKESCERAILNRPRESVLAIGRGHSFRQNQWKYYLELERIERQNQNRR